MNQQHNTKRFKCTFQKRVMPPVVVSDALELGYSIRHELQLFLLDLLNNTGPEHYAGQRPPQRSHEKSILSLDLWAFSVTCPRFEPCVCYKFSLHDEYFYLVSLHVRTSTRKQGGTT